MATPPNTPPASDEDPLGKTTRAFLNFVVGINPTAGKAVPLDSRQAAAACSLFLHGAPGFFSDLTGAGAKLQACAVEDILYASLTWPRGHFSSLLGDAITSAEASDYQVLVQHPPGDTGLSSRLLHGPSGRLFLGEAAGSAEQEPTLYWVFLPPSS